MATTDTTRRLNHWIDGLHDRELDELERGIRDLFPLSQLEELPGYDRVIRELQRRAEIRLSREEYGAHNDARWYDPRPLPEAVA